MFGDIPVCAVSTTRELTRQTVAVKPSHSEDPALRRTFVSELCPVESRERTSQRASSSSARRISERCWELVQHLLWVTLCVHSLEHEILRPNCGR